MTNQILSIIRDAIRHRYPNGDVPEVTADTDLSDLGVDDVDRWTIAYNVDHLAGAEIPDAEVKHWACVSDVVQAVRSRLTAGVV